MATNNILEKTGTQCEDYDALDPKRAIGSRGFVSPLPEPNLKTMIECTLRGFMYWGQKVHIAKDLAQALEHHNSITVKDGKTDVLMAAFYLISDIENAQLEEMSKFSREDITKKFGEIIKNGVFYLHNNNWIQVESGFLQKNFIDVDLLLLNPTEGYFFYQRGWFAPSIRGVIKFSNLMDSKSVEKIRFLSRNLYRKGFQITFNQDIETVMLGCREQTRRGQGKGSGARITDELMNSYEELLRLGKAYSVELRNPEGAVIAGTFGFVGGGELACDSIFYPAIEYENCANASKEHFKSNISYAKVAMLAMIDRAKMSGYKFIDLGMVTSFTKNAFRAEYISRDEFFELLDSSPKNEELDFVTEWNPIKV